MDLLNFRMIRTPRAPELEQPKIAAVLGELVDEVGVAQASGTAPDVIVQMIVNWRQGKDDPLQWSLEGQTASTPPQKYYALLGLTDRWLQERGDLIAADQFQTFREDALQQSGALDAETGRALLCDWLAGHYTAEPAATTLARLTRLLLVADALDTQVLPDTALQSASRSVVWDRLHRRPVVLPRFYAAPRTRQQPQPPSQPGRVPRALGFNQPVELVREARVSDLFVVRSEWSCYRLGEIASITNVLAGTRHEQENRRLREEEVTTREESERVEAREELEEDKLQSEMSREVDKASSLQVDVEGSVDVSGKYGFTKWTAHAGAAVTASRSESVRQGNKVARELVSRAASKVESRVREERVRRLLTKSEDISKFTLDNSGASHINGVYRWVDRIDRYQVFHYPDRLLLEFQIPEPAEYLRYRIKNRAANNPGGVQPPPSFELKAHQITEDNYTEYAQTFRASNLPPPPEAEIGITHVLSGNGTLQTSDKPALYAYPIVEKTADITLPNGYLADQVSCSATAMPARANWRVEYFKDAPIKGKEDVEGFHRIALTVMAGARATLKTKGSPYPAVKDFTVQFEKDPVRQGDHRSTVMFQDAVLMPEALPITINIAPAVREKLTLGMLAGGAITASVSCTIRCRRSSEAFREWQNTVYDILFDAWRGWQQDYRTAQLQQGAARLGGVDATSPARNKELIRDELKRQVVSWLLNDGGFAGYGAIEERPDSWGLIDLDKARAAAPFIQFFEQAFEWGNMTYITYGYYWARGSEWDRLFDIEASDPEFGRFLRAGSARVVVPARPGMEDAVLYWLTYGEPFLGGPLPVPGDPAYVSVATEIKDLTGAPDEGEPQECWETRLGTPLLWIDTSTMLPSNEKRTLGLEPNAPQNPLCE
jgi:hypothetical protein